MVAICLYILFLQVINEILWIIKRVDIVPEIPSLFWPIGIDMRGEPAESYDTYTFGLLQTNLWNSWSITTESLVIPHINMK